MALPRRRPMQWDYMPSGRRVKYVPTRLVTGSRMSSGVIFGVIAIIGLIFFMMSRQRSAVSVVSEEEEPIIATQTSSCGCADCPARNA